MQYAMRWECDVSCPALEKYLQTEPICADKQYVFGPDLFVPSQFYTPVWGWKQVGCLLYAIEKIHSSPRLSVYSTTQNITILPIPVPQNSSIPGEWVYQGCLAYVHPFFSLSVVPNPN